MIGFEHPEAFLLALPVVAWLRGRIWPRPAVGALRVMVVLALLGMLAGPYWGGAAEGRDLILVVDRSRSVPDEVLARAEELAGHAIGQRLPGDRIGMVAFGRGPVVEFAPSEGFRYRPPVQTLDRDATGLLRALEGALALVPPGRRGSLLLLSDGESTGADPLPAARAALRRGVRIDAVPVLRQAGIGDVAVEDVAVPDEVGPNEPFQFSAWVRADRAVAAAHVRLTRDGVVIAEGTRALRPGLNRIQFKDALRDPRVHRYAIEVRAPDDPLPENDRAQSVVRVAGPMRVLCVTPQGREDRLTRGLRAAGIAVAVFAPQTAPLHLDALDGFRAVVLENVAAEDLPRGAMPSLARWVRELGGGLMMTGGGASFGPGGYFRSPIEEVLPVTLEIRQEQRKFALAMAVVLDRSGSMGMTVASGETKMDLANQGTAAAIELLGRADHVAVVAVDSSPHSVVACQPVKDKESLIDKALSIESGGGGIYTYTALVAAADEMVKAPQQNKHIVLFADAADAEEPGKYETFVPELLRAGVTVSVIGLGTDTDSDAAFLEDVAKRGGGRCMFVSDAADLPRVFAQETIQVARSSLVTEPTPVEVMPDLVALGDLARGLFSQVGGYSIAYRRPNAQVGLRTADDQQAPLFAFWQHGLGRSAAFLAEVDGEHSGALAAWQGFGGFFGTVVRWLAGSDADDTLFATMAREGHEGVLRVEVPEGQAARLGEIRAQVLDPDGNPQSVWLQRTGENRLEARFPLSTEGVYRPVLQLADGSVQRVAPVTLPYSPEFEPARDPRRGQRILASLAEVSEGSVEPSVATLMDGPRDSIGVTSLAAWCAWAAVVLLLFEIAVRRLGLRMPVPALVLPQRAAPAKAKAKAKPARRTRAQPAQSTAEQPRPVAEPEAEPEPSDSGSLMAALERAKARSRTTRR